MRYTTMHLISRQITLCYDQWHFIQWLEITIPLVSKTTCTVNTYSKP